VGLSILVIGESGSGKSTSIRNLNPEATIVFSALGKGLPFEGSRKNYKVWDKVKNPQGNVVVTSSSATIAQWLRHIDASMPHITTVIVDDNTFLAAKELDRRRTEQTFNKFSDIAHDFLFLSELANTLREDLNIYFMHHITEEGDGILEPKKIKALSFGKLISDKLGSIEAQFEIVLHASKEVTKDKELKYVFKTRSANSTAKSPIGMFEEGEIDNDLNLVNEAINKYYY
jgi:AAA domain